MNKDKDKTKEQLIEELNALRARLAEMESAAERSLRDIEDANHTLEKEIEKRRIAEEKLSSSINKTNILLESLPDLIMDINHDCDITYINHSNGNGDPHNYIGKNTIELIPFEYRDDYTILLRNAFMKKESGKIIYKTEDDNTIMTRIVPIEDNNEVISVMAINSDISEQKENENRIRKMNLELEERVIDRTKQLKETNEKLYKSLEKEKDLSEMKTRFVSMVSHEYRTPLTVILFSTHLMNKYFETGDNEKFEKHRKRIRISVEAMTHLLENVTIAGVGTTGELKARSSPFDLLKCIEDVIEEEKALDGAKHEFKFRNVLLNRKITSDSRLLRLILCNIISNARKFSPKGAPIEIGLYDNVNSIILEVADQGAGIPEELKGNLFRAFYKRKDDIGIAPGLGLGLYIVKKCVNALNGSISFVSEKDNGSKFKVEIPV